MTRMKWRPITMTDLDLRYVEIRKIPSDEVLASFALKDARATIVFPDGVAIGNFHPGRGFMLTILALIFAEGIAAALWSLLH